MMSFEEAKAAIPWTATGIYLAYPTTREFKPTYRGHATRVNEGHTKVGITVKSFESRHKEYMRTFNKEVAFHPILELSPERLLVLEKKILMAMRARFSRSGAAREWFWTTDRQGMAEIVWRIASVSV